MAKKSVAFEVGITKFKDIEVHDELEAFKTGSEREMMVLMVVVVRELLNFIYGSSVVDLGVHDGGVSGEEPCVKWKVEHHELVFK
eukprot:3111440-Ditylum_brightwellii.AAC.1